MSLRALPYIPCATARRVAIMSASGKARVRASTRDVTAHALRIWTDSNLPNDGHDSNLNMEHDLDNDSPFLMNAMDDDDHDPRAALDDDADTASARSISLSSPSHSRRPSAFDANPYGGLEHDTVSTRDDGASIPDTHTSSVTSPEPSTYGADTKDTLEPSDSAATVTYPPPPLQAASSRESVQSFATSGSSRSRKTRPESMLPGAHDGPIVLGIALVDFNHLVCTDIILVEYN